MSFRLRRDRRGNTTTHQSAKFNELTVNFIKIVPKEGIGLLVNGSLCIGGDIITNNIKPKTGTLIEIDASLNFNNQGLVTTIPDNISVDSISAKTGSTITINDTLCLTNDIVLNNIEPKTGSLININASLNFNNQGLPDNISVDSISAKTGSTITINDTLCLTNNIVLNNIEPKTGSLININASLNFNNQGLVTTLPDNISVDSISAKTGSTITINDTLCLTNDLIIDSITPKTGSTIIVNGIFCQNNFEEIILSSTSSSATLSSLLEYSLIQTNVFNNVDNQGNALWFARVASSANDFMRCCSINASGEIFVCGEIGSTASIYHAGGTTVFDSIPFVNGTDGFVAKYDKDGTAQWTSRIASSSSERVYHVDSNNLGNIVAVGFFQADVTIFGSDEATVSFTNEGNSDVFLVNYNSSGIVNWATKIASTGFDVANAVSINDNNETVIAGHFTGSATFFHAGGTESSFTLTSSGQDAFLAKYDSNGINQWATHISGSGTIFGWGAYINNNDQIIVGGYGNTTSATFFDNGGTGTIALALNTGNNDAFIAKYNSSGITQWASKIAGTGIENGCRISMNDDNEIVALGSYFSPFIKIYDSTGLDVFTLNKIGSKTSNVGGDLFIVKYDSDGLFQWATNIAGAGDAFTGDTRPSGIEINNKGDIVLAGQFFEPPTGTGSATIYSVGGQYFKTFKNTAGQNHDGILVKYNGQGEAKWATKIAGTTTTEFGYYADINEENEVALACILSPNSNIYNSNDNIFYSNVPNSGAVDAYVIKYRDVFRTDVFLPNGKKDGFEKKIYVDGSGCFNLTIDDQLCTVANSDNFELLWSSSLNKWIRKTNVNGVTLGGAFSKSTNQAISSSVQTVISFDNKLFSNPSSSVDLTNNYLIAPITGNYLISCKLTLTSAANLQFYININGTPPTLPKAGDFISSNRTYYFNSLCLQLNKGDTVRFIVNSNINNNVTGNSSSALERTEGWMIYLGS